ncbi:hypothetical protein ACIGT4_11630 [Streptomyces sioyaensis]
MPSRRPTTILVERPARCDDVASRRPERGTQLYGASETFGRSV